MELPCRESMVETWEVPPFSQRALLAQLVLMASKHALPVPLACAQMGLRAQREAQQEAGLQAVRLQAARLQAARLQAARLEAAALRPRLQAVTSLAQLVLEPNSIL